MIITIEPGPLRGSVRVPASKSQAQRLLICAALSRGETELACSALSADIKAAVRCLRALGAGIDYSNGIFHIRPIEKPVRDAVLDCGESGATLRFLLPVACALGGGAVLRLGGRLPERPLSPLWEALEAHGAELGRPEEDTITVSGKLKGGDYPMDAGVSSQFISGLLFALPLTETGGTVRMTGRIESANYIGMTCQALAAFGVECAASEDGREIRVKAVPFQSPEKLAVEGDWSAAAFWVVAGALSGEEILCQGLNPDSAQGDRAVTSLVGQIRKGNAVIDAANVPDLVPALAVQAAVSPRETRFVNAGRLRLKESDRIKSVCAMLRALGAWAEETPDGLIVRGQRSLTGGTVDSVGDHRIAMSAAVASPACTGPVTVVDAGCVDKSYPAFWEDFQALGGRIR